MKSKWLFILFLLVLETGCKIVYTSTAEISGFKPLGTADEFGKLMAHTLDESGYSVSMGNDSTSSEPVIFSAHKSWSWDPPSIKGIKKDPDTILITSFYLLGFPYMNPHVADESMNEACAIIKSKYPMVEIRKAYPAPIAIEPTSGETKPPFISPDTPAHTDKTNPPH